MIVAIWWDPPLTDFYEIWVHLEGDSEGSITIFSEETLVIPNKCHPYR